MPTPTVRTPVRVARGTYANLNASASDIQEGEICYATDQDILYVKEGSNLVNASHMDITHKADLASPSFTGTPVFSGDGATAEGELQLNCALNSHGVKIKAPPHSAGATYTLTLPDDTGTTGQFLSTDGSGGLSWGTVSFVSPAFTGTPTAPTATNGTNTTQIATTEFVETRVGGVDLTTKADLASPTFTGVPVVPTATVGTNTTQIASTAFVLAELLANSTSWTAVSTATNAANDGKYLADTSTAAFTVTLPASPSAGDIVQVGDAKGAFATNNLTVGRNGSNIVGQAADLVANVANAVLTLIYSGDATVGWLVK